MYQVVGCVEPVPSELFIIVHYEVVLTYSLVYIVDRNDKFSYHVNICNIICN